MMRIQPTVKGTEAASSVALRPIASMAGPATKLPTAAPSVSSDATHDHSSGVRFNSWSDGSSDDALSDTCGCTGDDQPKLVPMASEPIVAICMSQSFSF